MHGTKVYCNYRDIALFRRKFFEAGDGRAAY